MCKSLNDLSVVKILELKLIKYLKPGNGMLSS